MLSPANPFPEFDPFTLVALLRGRALHQANRRAYTFLGDGDKEEAHLTYAELDRQARAIAAWLQAMHAPGERALILYPPGLAYIAAFFGCLYAGVVAVPAYPPRLNRPMPRLQAIVADARPTVALTVTSILSNLERRFEHTPELKPLRWLDTERMPAGLESDWREASVMPDTLAFLQYTSGSTGTPKGVMVSHGNLIHNLEMIRQGFQIDQLDLSGCGVFWLPSYHDMGLIGGILEPMYVGAQSVLMSPASFLQRPAHWLEVITRFQGRISGAPNFAYELCVEKIAPEQRETLDLSSWAVAFCGAEPIRLETLERFAEAFAPVGFNRNAFYPCYGLAEATLMVSGGRGPAFPVTRKVQRRALEAGRVVAAKDGEPGAQSLVSCGGALLDQKVLIVEPEFRTISQPSEVGEVWAAGCSIAKGYWNRPQETEETFRAYTADTGEGPFLRTGDLGFMFEGELFITGRLKDLIIIHGRNHYSQEIELTVERSHPALRPGSGAVFSVEFEGVERLVVVQEVERQYRSPDIGEVASAIRRAVAEEHELDVYAVTLIRALSIPKTSSGKIQRHVCRERFLDGTLEPVVEWRAILPATEVAVTAAPFESTQAASAPSAGPPQTAAALESWLVTKISECSGIKPHAIDVRQPFVYFGLNSVQAVSLTGELEAWLGRPVPPTLAWDYPTIESLSRYLASRPSDVPEVDSSATGATHQSPLSSSEPIAIIALGCRFPGAPDPEAFWQLLRKGVDAITEVPPDRWDADAFYDPNPATPGKLNMRWGGFVEGIDLFDPGFFGISPYEAARMDPQQRLLLEVAWEALENAGIAPDRLAGSQTGVFVGISSFDYSHFQFGDPARVDAYAGTGNAHSIAANRLSYILDLRGPSVAVDTACSSSLVAVHLACQSLRMGESDLAIAGGVNVLLRPELTITLSQAQMMAAGGRCKTFDADADGYVRGEGCGVVILKRLSDALRDDDNVLAVIRGSAVNQDGRSNGLTAPNGPAQQAVIRQALASAGVASSAVGYVEAHGTGTPLGDPIEFESLKAALMPGRASDQLCLLGSVKTNIGHLEAAAGIAGLIKAVLTVQHGEIPPHLHLKKLNPHINLDGTPFTIPTECRPWPANGNRRVAGVSSFGFGGTNAHVVLEEFCARSVSETPGDSVGTAFERPLHVLALSARSEGSLKELARRYADESSPGSLGEDEDFPSLCFTANAGRSHFAQRLAVVAGSGQVLREKLSAFAAGHEVDGLLAGRVQNRKRPKVAFLFTGQGSQYVGMGRLLYETQPTFHAVLDRCDELLRPYLERPLLSVFYPSDGESSPLDQTAYTQPALFALEYALAELWRSWGIEPDVVLGHSVGEYVAACIAGALSLENGLKLIAARGRLMQSLPAGGAMATVFADQARVAAVLNPHGDRVSIAALNGPENTVISGECETIRAVLASLETQGIAAQPLTVSHAFHSPLMEPILAEFERTAGHLEFAPLRLPLVSNVRGQTIEPGMLLDAGYWRCHVRETVQFAAGMEALAGQGAEVFVEIGPHPALLGMGRRCLPQNGTTWLPTLKRDRGDWQVLLASLAEWYVKGGDVDWAAFDHDYRRRRVSLPTYPFERERCWLGPSRDSRSARTSEVKDHSATDAGETNGPRFNLADWLYELRWLPKSRVDQTLIRLAPDYMPAPAQVAEGLRSRVAELNAEPHVKLYEELSPQLDRLSVLFILQAFRELGGALHPGQRFSLEVLVERLGIVPEHRRLTRPLVEMLEEDRILIPLGTEFEVGELPAQEDPRARCQSLLEDYPAYGPELRLIGQCGPRLAEVLRGAADPLQVLFPDGSLAAAEALYRDSATFRPYNTVVAESIRAALAGMPADRVVRILEIGAGTGGTTAYVLPHLPADRTEYLLTDVSSLFTSTAGPKFRDYPFVRAQLLDIELEPEVQGVAPHQFDVILATDVLHATRDLRQSLRHVRRLLAPKGWFVLLEGTRPERWVDLVFGLTQGWWKFTDRDVRPRYPLVSPTTWRSLLEEAGFGEMAILPEAADRGELSQQVVILARGPEVKWDLRRMNPAVETDPGVGPGPTHSPAPTSPEGARWLIFTDRDGIGGKLAEALALSGEGAVLVSSGSGFQRIDAHRFEINPAHPEDLSHLFEEAFRAQHERCRGVIHLWSLDAKVSENTPSTALAAAQHSGCGSVVHLVQAANRAGWLGGLPLWLVTRGAQPVTGDASPLAVAQAPLWGIGRVIAQEQSTSPTRLIDLDPADSIEAAFGSLWEEIRSPDPDGENQLAFRGGQRYALRLLRRASSTDSRRPFEWRRDGTYLITGGLGDLGLAGARWMVEQGARRLILLGRTKLPPRARWDRVNGDHALASRVAAIRELESLGADVHLASVDVSNERQLKTFLARYRREGWPPLRGVMHLAGVIDDRMLLDLTAASLTAVLAPKLMGAWNLHHLLKDDPLDFFVMFSSAGTLLGQIGQANYAAANAFLDALAHHRRAHGRQGLTINWGAWEELGFATAEGGRRLIKHLAPRGIQSLPPKGALEALGRLLVEDSTQAAVLPINWSQYRHYVSAGTEPPLLSQLAREAVLEESIGSPKASPGLTREAVLAADPTRRGPMVEAYLAERVAKTLGLLPSKLDIRQPLDSLGLDSLMAIDVKNRLESDFGLSVPVVVFLQGPSIADLAAKILEQLKAEAVSPTAPVARAERDRPDYPLSYGQHSMWFLNQLAPESAAYNVVYPAYIRSPMDRASLRSAFQALLDRHPILRTTLHVHGGQAVQVIHPHLPVHFVETDASRWSQAEVDEFLFQRVHTPFDLERGPVVRVNLLTRSATEHILLFIVHHIAIDFWSLVGLIDELGRLYAAEVAHRPAALPPLDYQYVDFVRWQTEMLAGPPGERLWAYWQEQLAGELPALNLPSDRPRPPVQTYTGNLVQRMVPEALARGLRELAIAEAVTLNTLLVAAFQALLHRYTGQTDILLGTLATGRSRAEFESIAGYFINPIVLRADLAGNPTFKAFLAQVRQTMLAALEHEDAPFSLLVERLQPTRDASHTPLFQVMFIMLQPRHLEQPGVSQFFMGQTGARMNLGGLAFESFSLEQRTAMFDLTHTVVDAGGSLSTHWNYNTDLFEAATIARMAQHFECVLEGIVARPEAQISDLPLLTPDERRQLLVDWNQTHADFPLDRTFNQLFEAQVERTPDAVAVIFKGEPLTYRELNRQANRMARFLVAQGVGTDSVVPLLAERGLHFLIAMLAVFKAGGAYLPLDPLQPPGRHAQVLGQSRAPLILAAAKFIPMLVRALEHLPAESRPAAWEIEARLDKTRAGSNASEEHPGTSSPGESNDGEGTLDDNLSACASPTDLAYVIFTSGSTGLPKGAMVEQRGMLNHLFAKIAELQLTAADVVAETAAQWFDISVWQFLAALLVGGRVHIFEDEIAHDPASLLEWCDRAQVTILETVPSLLRAMLETLAARGTNHSSLTTLRWMIPTGEALPPELARQWLTVFPNIPLLNAYGPTECSDDVAHYLISEPPAPHVARMPIGRPIPNMRLYVLDARLQPVPIGVTGELCVGGLGVGRGYLNDPERTAEAFLRDPFSDEPGARLYKTGDLVRHLPDGNLEFIGRLDHQVKVRGFRIELGEIEAALGQHPAVRDKVVVAREDSPTAPWDRRLVAYVVLHPDSTCTVSELSGLLKQQLPEYMVPSAFVFLDALPLTLNGKIDRRALPPPEGIREELKRTYVPPRTPIEATLAELWTGVLGVERVGIHDNFFELGGDSILALQAIARATEMGLRFTPKQLLQCQTIAELAAVANTAPLVHAEQGLVTGPVPLTPIQRWFFERELPEPHHYNQAILLEVRERLDATILEAVLQQLVRHHDALRLRFARGEASWTQTAMLPDDAPLVSEAHLSGLPESDQEAAIEATTAQAQASLNLTDGPLLRALLFDLGPQRPGRLLLVAHHLVVDVVSWRILLEDLYAGYAQFSRGQVIQLPPKTTSFKHWAEQLVEGAQSPALWGDLDGWLAPSRGSAARLPVDYPDRWSENAASSARTLWSSLSADETESLLHDVPQAYNTRINDLLLAALAIAVARWTGAPSLVVDLERHGREEIFDGVDVSRTVGWFTSLFPVRLDLEGISAPGDLIKSIKEQLRRVPNDGIGFGVLKYLSGNADVEQQLRRLPQAEISFNYLGQLDLAAPAGVPFAPAGESVGPLHSPLGTRAYLLDINASVAEDRLQVAWTYSENLHRPQTIETLARHYSEALRELIAHCVSPGVGGYTPSDFPEAGLGQDELDRVLADIELADMAVE